MNCAKYYEYGNQKSIKSIFDCLFLKLMKRSQTRFHVHIMMESQKVKKSKFINKSKLSLGQILLAVQVFPLYRYFIETATADIDMLLHVLLQLSNNDGFVVICDVIILFCPLLDD